MRNTKHKVSRIEITRAEGPTAECGIKHTLSSYEEANKLLLLWSLTAPIEGGYNKCDFTVYWDDGDDWDDINRTAWGGRYDLHHYSRGQDEGPVISLGKHISDFCEFSAGLIRPDWFTDENWKHHYRAIRDKKEEFQFYLDNFEM